MVHALLLLGLLEYVLDESGDDALLMGLADDGLQLGGAFALLLGVVVPFHSVSLPGASLSVRKYCGVVSFHHLLGELVELELVVEVLLGVGRVEDFIELEVPLDQPLVSSFLFLHLTQPTSSQSFSYLIVLFSMERAEVVWPFCCSWGRRGRCLIAT
mmetsp:Transcript_22066/g.21246  ORF Transcript_22066/g.21246 Transcript_22066/m.21246 type:complete len:157 (-) Transcript_22066:57-527(-)